MKNLADENDRVEIYIHLLNLTKHSCEKCNYMYTSHIISYRIISYHISSCTVLEIETDGQVTYLLAQRHLSCARPRLTVEESIHTIGRKTYSCDWKELQSEDRHLTLAHGVIDLDVASFRWLLLFGLQHCEPTNI